MNSNKIPKNAVIQNGRIVVPGQGKNKRKNAKRRARKRAMKGEFRMCSPSFDEGYQTLRTYQFGSQASGPLSRASAPVATANRRMTPFLRSERPTLAGASVRIVGCDYYGTITTSDAGFADNLIIISPGESTSFPRLTAIAAVFELYRFTRVRATLVGAAASTQVGTMTAAFQYEYGSSSYTAAQIRNEEGQVTTKFWETLQVEMNCKRAVRPWFNVANQSEEDSADGIQAQLHIGTDETSSDIVAGDLFLEYDVEFAQGQASGAPELGSLRNLLVKKGAAEAISSLLRKSGFVLPKTISLNRRCVATKTEVDPTVLKLESLAQGGLSSAALPSLPAGPLNEDKWVRRWHERMAELRKEVNPVNLRNILSELDLIQENLPAGAVVQQS